MVLYFSFRHPVALVLASTFTLLKQEIHYAEKTLDITLNNGLFHLKISKNY